MSRRVILHGGYSHCCCLWYWHESQPTYLLIEDVKAYATIRSTASQTVLEQTFTNTNDRATEKCYYNFPLYAGVSVNNFTCHIEKKALHGVVIERAQAKAVYDQAVASGQSAALFEQNIKSSDIFKVSLGNVPAKASIKVRIEFVGELKYDAEEEAIRYTIPTKIAPRYGIEGQHEPTNLNMASSGKMDFTVDVDLADGSLLKNIQSPSHPISVSIGTNSSDDEADPVMTKGCARLSSNQNYLQEDFVLMVKAKNAELPKAILETHPHLTNHRALMTTLVPKFSLPQARPEVVFIADRSGSMAQNIPTLITALNVFLKSLPQGIKFNICSFGSHASSLWTQSRGYDQESLDQALAHVKDFSANLGGTETWNAIEKMIKQRFTDLPLEIVLLTDGDIWQQEEAFRALRKEVSDSQGQIRLFPLGIGQGVSHSLIEGLARAGDGFAQAVQNGERMDRKVVRMLKAALSPHIADFSLEIEYGKDDGDDFELVDRVESGMRAACLDDKEYTATVVGEQDKPAKEKQNAPISLFDPSANPDKPEELCADAHLPKIAVPPALQTPTQIPSLYAFSRTTVYVLLSPSTVQRNPQAVVLRGTSAQGPLELRILVTVLDKPGTMIHSLAARKAAEEFEEGHGWLTRVRTKRGLTLEAAHPSAYDDIVKREAVRLGETYQVANRWCSFVAVAANTPDEAIRKQKELLKKTEEGIKDPDAMEVDAATFEDDQEFGAEDGGNSIDLHSTASSGGALSLFGAGATRGGGGGFRGGRGGGRGMSSKLSMRSGGGLFATGPPPPAPAMASAPRFLQIGQRRVASDQPFDLASAQTAAAFPPSVTEGMSEGISSAAMESNITLKPDFKHSATPRKARKADSRGLKPQSYGSVPIGECRSATSSGSALFASAPGTMLDREHSSATTSRQPPTDPASIVTALIDLQDFDGKWKASRDLAELLGVKEEVLVKSGDKGCTAMVVVFMEEKMKSEMEVWEMVVDKARDWLIQSGASKEVEDEARAALGLKQ